MAEGVVVDLKLVNVEHADREGDAQADGVLPALAADGVVAPPVGHAGELIYGGVPLHLIPILEEFNVGIHPGPDNGGVEGLGDVIHGPQGKPLLFVLNIVEAGDEDHRDAAENHLLLKHFQKLKTVGAGHDDVQKNQGIIPHLRLLQAFLSGIHHGDFVVPGQDGTEEIGLNGAVVYNQNFIHNRFPPSWTRLRGSGLAAAKDSRILLPVCHYIKLFPKREVLT